MSTPILIFEQFLLIKVHSRCQGSLLGNGFLDCQFATIVAALRAYVVIFNGCTAVWAYSYGWCNCLV